MPKLGADQISKELKTLAGWEYRDDAISKRFKFKEFLDGIRFVNRIAEIAEAADHHPDIMINYTRIAFTCSTHSEGGVTEKDLKLAQNLAAVHDVPAPIVDFIVANVLPEVAANGLTG